MAINESLKKYIGVELNEGAVEERKAKELFNKMHQLRTQLEKAMTKFLKDEYVEDLLGTNPEDDELLHHLEANLKDALEGFDAIDDWLDDVVSAFEGE